MPCCSGSGSGGSGNGSIRAVRGCGCRRWCPSCSTPATGPGGRRGCFSELIGGPAELSVYAPTWQPLFWDLGERTVEELLQATGEWLAALAVVRAEGEAEAGFHAALTQVLRRLERISETETVRWQELLWFVLSWSLRRRPGEEREALVAAARESQSDVQHREEVRKMSEAIERT